MEFDSIRQELAGRGGLDEDTFLKACQLATTPHTPPTLYAEMAQLKICPLGSLLTPLRAPIASSGPSRATASGAKILNALTLFYGSTY